MMTPTHIRYCAHARRQMINRIATTIFLVAGLLTSLGWAGLTWGQADLPRVGILAFASATDDPRLEAFLEELRRTLADQGWVEGKNVSFVYRSAHNDPSQFAPAAAALADQKVNVVFALGAPALRAVYAVDRMTPIVAGDFTTDAIAEGYIQSYARPGGNVTGVFLDAPEIAGKWFELLKAMVPGLARVSVLWDPGPGTTHLKAVRTVAELLDIKLQVLEVRKPDDIESAFDALRGRPQALIILPSPMIYGQSARLAELALSHRLPATSMDAKFAAEGGALSYGPTLTSTIERVAVLVAKILAGNSPAELPIERPTKIQLVVNLKTAKALGITIPQSILLRADEVIQ